MKPPTAAARSTTPIEPMHMRPLTSSAEKIQNANDKLKSELLEVISTMEVSLSRVNGKRSDRLKMEKEAGKIMSRRLGSI
jgi:hypothetical protein